VTTNAPGSRVDAIARDSTLEGYARDSMQCLRHALAEALAAAGVDPIRPRHAARQLGVDKTLMWRVSRIVGQPDVFQSMGHVPRRGGVGILCRALVKAGVPGATVERLRASLVAFDALAERHGGDRATFELLAAGFASAEHQSQSLEQSRKLAFRGNSAVWGVQARLQLAACILFPSDVDHSRVDLVRVFGFVDLIRLRDDVRWPLARRTFFDDSLAATRVPEAEPLDRGPVAPRSALIQDFSSEPVPELHAEERTGDERRILAAGVPGRTGMLTAIFGCRHRAIGARHAGESDHLGQVLANLLTPVERLQFDLLVHEDLHWSQAPGVAVLGAFDSRPLQPGSLQAGLGPPFTESIVDLGAGIAGCATPEMPRYTALLEWVFDRIAEDPAAFRAFRFGMAYPPLPAKAVLFSVVPPAEAGAP
jgi:hypothetical protein